MPLPPPGGDGIPINGNLLIYYFHTSYCAANIFLL